MNVIDLGTERVRPTCEKIQGRRHRRCQREAQGVIEYTVMQRVRVRNEDHNGRVFFTTALQPRHFRWDACKKHKDEARRNGAVCVAVYENGSPF